MADQPSGANGQESDRDLRGRFTRGNTAAVTHGARSAVFWAAAQAQVEAMATAIMSDAGHTPESAPAALRIGAYAGARAALVEEGTWAAND